MITLIKEDVLSLGQIVGRTLEEIIKLLQKQPGADLFLIERQEEEINQACQIIEEKCLALLMQRENLSNQEIRALLSSTVIAAKFERLADHANRVAKIACWAAEDQIPIPQELEQMAAVVHHMVQDVLLCFLTDACDKAIEIIKRDNQVDYLHDSLSKKLLSNLGNQETQEAQMRAQFLFCARFLERMGDACTSVAKRVYFIVTGERLLKDKPYQ